MTNSILNDPRVQRAIELIWQEATLLDDKHYEAWQQLFTDDAIYVVPIDPETADFETSLNMIYDDQRMRKLRVERLVQGFSPSAVAAARTVRVLSRFTVKEISENEVTVRSAQIINAFKRESFTTLGADVEHRIVLEGDDAKIKLKVVRLIDSEDAVSASGYLV
ncbi:aromatic-ring-hydroxylating dioxygenase subunit beta [Pseudoglutamicibacter cumminsii]|uniref:Aromatic-ring-hydroxylating dioxygenase subunit beta n=1 Tax=Pseudoglutamicibacter cumminsii TaxID=156979 RepID=A0ABX5L6S4_9MICC|nr:aromatic-ring-hydroxylating dioxygenase subunit beta [Pseudoglutamicibacter cumminsii]PWI27821.1 hypothetical protein CAY35_05050 [Pseudoglutamicibacter cumminsii]